MEDWDTYRLILALHRGKTLRHAAKLLAVNHTTVARRLAQLNRSHGAIIVDSTALGYSLTNAGQSLLHTALQMEALIKEDKSILRAEQIDHCGHITVSIPPAIAQVLLIEELHSFALRNPMVKLSVQCSYQLADIDNSEADVVVRVANEPSEHLVGHRAGTVYVNYYGHEQYLQQPSEYFSWLVSSHNPSHTQWIESSPYPQAPAGIAFDDLMVRHSAANQGLGLIRGACYIANTLPHLRLVCEQQPQPFSQIWVLTHPKLIDVPRIKCLMSELYQLLSDRKALLQGQS